MSPLLSQPRRGAETHTSQQETPSRLPEPLIRGAQPLALLSSFSGSRELRSDPSQVNNNYIRAQDAGICGLRIPSLHPEQQSTRTRGRAEGHATQIHS